MRRVAPARAAAFEILVTLERGSGRSDELLHQPIVERLSPQDRNLATNLVMGTLRWQLILDARTAALLSRPRMELDPSVRVALRLGAFQLLHLDRVPVYAAIDESVELAKIGGNKFAASMVNAILRKVARQHKPTQSEVANRSDMAATNAHPQWLVERWISEFGLETTKKICEYDQQPAPAFIRLLAPEAEEALKQEGIELAPANFLANARRVLRGDVLASPVFRKGMVRVQDEGSQLVGELAGNGWQILDACAAPGGKTGILAERNPHAAITACDVSKKRLVAMQRLLSKDLHGADITFKLANVAKLELKPEFDLVLCDAPCSGTGTLARNPEIRHRLRPEELSRQHQRQVAILSSLMRSVKPGRRLLYSTCSLEPEENELVVRECLGHRDDFELVSVDHEIERLESAGILHPEGAADLRAMALFNGGLRTLPGTQMCDGFFAALLVRSA